MAEKEQFKLSENEYYRKGQIDIDALECERAFWNVDETISELSYLTHDYFRYYGKFPSKIGKMMIEELLEKGVIDPQRDFLLDNYVGSGTSLVEAKLAGIDSFGLDINPFAVLACRVKTYNYDVERLKAAWDKIRGQIDGYNRCVLGGLSAGAAAETEDAAVRRMDEEVRRLSRDETFSKWFSGDVIRQLYGIKATLLSQPLTREREFFDLAFFAVIRRVSRAYDAEVRPHVNKKKRERDAVEAYVKKVNEMLLTMEEWNRSTSARVCADAYLVNNSDTVAVDALLTEKKEQTGKALGAVLSHPPYLNCFDYIPVYKLKFLWADGFEEIFGKKSYEEIKQSEIKSYPVNSDAIVEQYFRHNRIAYQMAYEHLKAGGYCCIVIGDCTVKNELFSVHKTFITMMQEIGFVLVKLVYRSTSYGTGRYAYNFRADYSEHENSKQDAILFFRK